VEECAVYISQTRGFGGRSPSYILGNNHTTLDRLGANRRTVGDPCILQLHLAGFILCRKCKLAVTHSIFTWSQLYIPQDLSSFCHHHPQDLPLLFFIRISSLPHQPIIAPWTPQWGASESESSRMSSTLTSMPHTETQLQRRHLWVHCDAANAATKNMPLDAQSKIVCKTGTCKNEM